MAGHISLILPLALGDEVKALPHQHLSLSVPGLLLLLFFQQLKEANNDLTFLAMIITSLGKCVSLKPEERRKSAEATLLKMQEPGLIC